MGIHAVRLDRNGVPSASVVDTLPPEDRLALMLGPDRAQDGRLDWALDGALADPVLVITAARVRLRRLRRLTGGVTHDPAAAASIRVIVQTRDDLLKRMLHGGTTPEPVPPYGSGDARAV